MGANEFYNEQQPKLLVSIHAPVMGAKLRELETRIKTQVSIHAPVMGAKMPMRCRPLAS